MYMKGTLPKGNKAVHHTINYEYLNSNLIEFIEKWSLNEGDSGGVWHLEQTERVL